MFPYPSGEGLHMGHAFNYTIGDIYSRFKRMIGFNVLYPMGYDSFGLPAENAAIKFKSHPKKFTEKAINNFIQQQKELGLSYDWDRVLKTSDPEYYKWNQYFFLEFMKKGLIYRKKSTVNWCPSCNSVLANEQVHNGKCWRHKETDVEQKQLEQWFIKITKYSEELLKDIQKLEWPNRIKIMQENWIGKSFGTEIVFKINGGDVPIANVQGFRETLIINFKINIKGKELGIKEIVKFRLSDGSYYTKLFLDEGYVLADDSNNNYFILVKEVKSGLKIKGGKVNYKSKEFEFLYNAEAVAEEVQGESIFRKGEKESFWDYKSKDNSYLSLGIVEKNKERLDFFGEIVQPKDISFIKPTENWRIFTTRPDTLFGVTFMVVSALHHRLTELVTKSQKKEVESFLKKLKSASEKVLGEMDKEGVFTGSYAIHPLTQEKIPVYAGNFVVAEYGSGMVMAVPAHDQRDFDFAKKYKLPIKVVVNPEGKILNKKSIKEAYDGAGKLINSGAFNDLFNEEAKEHITKALESKNIGKKTIQYKLRDWLVSRQRYWGTPIPIVYCDKCGIVPEKDLPIKLPEDVKFGEGNPLGTNKEFVNTLCPKCKGKAKRETDTMDTFFDSSWYFLRFCDNKNDKMPFDKNKAKYWMPVDQYIGGAEHACMHLIYARFFTKALRDLGYLNFNEPFTKLFNQGMIHGEDGHVMSKSMGNVVDPIVISNKYSADSLRLFLVSLVSPDKDFAWTSTGVEGSLKFIKKILEYISDVKFGKTSARVESKLNKTIEEVTTKIDDFKYNSAVIKIRELFEEFEKEISKEDFGKFVKLLHPFCPHITEELWEQLGNKNFISLEKWPKFDEKKIDKRFEEIDEMVDKTTSDIVNILNLVKEKTGKEAEKVYIYTLPNEINNFNEEKLRLRVNKIIKVYAVNDKKKYDPQNKSSKAKPGRPAIFVE